MIREWFMHLARPGRAGTARRARNVVGSLGAVLALSLVFQPAVASAQGARQYVLDPAESSVRIHVGKTGLLGVFGHEHDVAAPTFSGNVTVPAEGGSGARVSVTFVSGDLRVLPQGEPPEDVPKVQATMLGPQVLDVQRYPRITFVSDSVTAHQTGPGTFDAQVVGELTLHGVTRQMTIPVQAQLSQGRLVATGETTVRQTDFGITPVTAGVGTVKVKDEVTIRFRLVGKAAP